MGSGSLVSEIKNASTLPSLRDQSAKEVEGILPNLTLDMLPNPGIGVMESDLTPDARDLLIQEIRISLGLKMGDNSPRAMSRIYEYLAREMGNAALADVDLKEVRTRLGNKGNWLRPCTKSSLQTHSKMAVKDAESTNAPSSLRFNLLITLSICIQNYWELPPRN
jgi:hypothetical protein